MVKKGISASAIFIHFSVVLNTNLIKDIVTLAQRDVCVLHVHYQLKQQVSEL